MTIDGLRLRDEKTGDSLYHHPVHKISFIAQDMTDSRAFGYIFGSPDSGHRFFGIKTDKAASQVVLAMRDLFQVVFELKKKEIELARQHIQSKTIQDLHPVTLNMKSSAHESAHVTYTKCQLEPAASKYSTGKEVSLSWRKSLLCCTERICGFIAGIAGVCGRLGGLGAGVELATKRHHTNGTNNTE